MFPKWFCKTLVPSAIVVLYDLNFSELPKRLMSVFEQDQNPSLRPGQQWRETFLDPTIVQLFFKVGQLYTNLITPLRKNREIVCSEKC